MNEKPSLARHLNAPKEYYVIDFKLTFKKALIALNFITCVLDLCVS